MQSKRSTARGEALVQETAEAMSALLHVDPHEAAPPGAGVRGPLDKAEEGLRGLRSMLLLCLFANGLPPGAWLVSQCQPAAEWVQRDGR